MKSDQQRAQQLFGKNEVLIVMEDGSGKPASITIRRIKWNNVGLLFLALSNIVLGLFALYALFTAKKLIFQLCDAVLFWLQFHLFRHNFKVLKHRFNNP